MSAISSWLLSIAGVILLSVLAEFVLPEGQMNKYTKVIFSFVILFVVIVPLPKIFGKDFDFSKFFIGQEDVLQEDYLYQLNIDKLEVLSTDLNEQISSAGLKNVKITISASVLQTELEIFSVLVDLRNLEFDKSFQSQNVSGAKDKILDIIDNFQILKGVEVKFYEQI